MKQILPLALALLPCLAWAQYPSNGNQKITLGEQTTADGLIWRGVASIDTVTATSKITRTNKQDTSAYLLLDTVTNLLWHYKIGSNGWSQAGGSTFDTTTLNLTTRFATKLNISDTASMLTPYFRKLDTTNIKYVNTYGTQTVNGAKTFSSTVTGARFNPTSSNVSGTGMYLPSEGNLSFSVNGVNAMNLSSSGSVGINVFPYNWGTYKSLDIGLGGSISSVQYDNLVITTNGYNTNNTVWRYKSNSLPAVYEQYKGAHYFGYALTGTKDSIFSFAYPLVLKLNLLGLGTTNPAVQFHTTGGVRFETFAGGGTTTLSVDNNGNLSRTSSIELKNNITNIKYGLNEILKINPINFNWKDIDKFGNENENGFIAEDVYNIIPNVVYSDKNGIFMDYTKLIPVLTKAIQEQQALIKALEQRIINLENK